MRRPPRGRVETLQRDHVQQRLRRMGRVPMPTMRIDRKPGQKMEADWAGTKMALADRDTGEPVDVYVFVARLPFSGKLYAEGFLGVDSEC